MNDILELIGQEQPDVVALQEVYDGHDAQLEPKFRSMDVLRAALRYPHEHFAPGFLERTEFGKVEQGNAVLSRFPIIESHVTPGDVPYGEREDKPAYYEHTPRNLQRVALELPDGGILQVFNTQGVWGLDGGDSKRRLSMARAIVVEVVPYDRVILAGDFNVQERTRTIGLVEEHLVNIFKGERMTSFDMRNKTDPGYATAVVDMIFVSPSIRVLEKSIPQNNVSDHQPMVVVLDIPSPK